MLKKIIYISILFGCLNLLHAEETNRITKIVYVGLKKVDSTKIEEMIKPLRDKKGRIERSKIGIIMTNIRQIYEKSGYDIEITSSEKRTGKKTQLQFVIQEGIPNRVKYVTWITNGTILKKENKSKEWNIYNRITTVKSLTNDYRSFMIKFWDKGLYDLRLSNVLLVTDRSHKKYRSVNVVASFVTGPGYRFGGYSGPLLRELPDKMKKQFHKSQAVLNSSKMTDDLNTIRTFYIRKGFPFVKILTNIQKIDGLLSVDLVLSNDKTYYFKGLNIKGLVKTKEYVIARENPFKQGDPYSEKKKELFEWKFGQTQFFRNFSMKPREDGVDGFILDMNLEEQQTGMITLGATFSSGSGIGGYERVEEFNFLGRGFRLLQEINFSQLSKCYLFGFKNPRIAGTPFSLMVLPYYLDRVIYTTLDKNYKKSYWKSSLGSIFGTDLRLDSYSKFGILNRIESKEIWGVSPELYWMNPGRYSRNATQIYLKRSTFDNYYSPHKGYGFRASLELSYGTGFNDTYMKTILHGNLCLGVTKKSSFILNGSYGNITIPPFKGFGSVSGEDLFHLGSVSTVRGFYDSHPWPSAGLTRYYINLEYRYYIHQLFSGVLFFDAGDLWNTWFRWYDIDPARISCSTGMGININIPMLPLQFVLAYPLLRRGRSVNTINLANPVFEFSIGYFFSVEDSGDPSFESMDYRQ